MPDIKNPAVDHPIGARRWQCWLARRSDVNDASVGNLTQLYQRSAQVWADIAPVGTATYYENIDTTNEITHRVFIRWRPNVNLFDCLIRDYVLPNGQTERDIYQIRRSSEWQGKKRYLMLDTRLEGHAQRFD